MTQALPKILLIADRPKWAIDSKAQNLRRALGGQFDFVQRFQAEVSKADIGAADLVVIFYWLEILNMTVPDSALVARKDQLLIGICSHFELEGDLREPGLAMLRRLPTAVFVNNRALEREYAPLLNSPVHYTPNGVDTTFFTPTSMQAPHQPGELRVGWAGSLKNQGATHRGFHNVIEPAVAAVPGARLNAAIREERWRDRDEMLDFYRSIDVYVCASRSEGTPNPCLEAAACGVPVVTTRVGNMPEFIEDGVNGLTFDGTVSELTDRLKLLRDEPSVLSSMSVQIRTSVRQWDWDLQAKNYARMFESVLSAAR